MAQVTAPGRPASPEQHPSPAAAALASTVQQDADMARGRSRTRYPSHLAADGQRKPYLHRRGTSKTLESLEDLLREAGYKETRVFSAAESEAAAADDPASRASGVSAAVVGFITGLIPLSTRSLGRSAGQAVVAAGHGPTIRVDPPQSQSQSQSRGSSKASRASSRACDSASSSMTIRPNDFLRPTHSTPGPASNQYRSMRSTVLLRHAASSPAMARSKSHSAPRRKRPHGSSSKKHVPPAPPVPQVPDTWMSALTKAFGASAGSPFGDRTNAANSSSTPIRIHRPMPASSAVSRTSVTCRSTPASRSSSRAPPPLLTLIRTENDEWVASPPADADAGDDSFMHEEDDDDDDSEITLERILAPHALARRQRSICSLRRNLQTSMTQARAERRSRAGSDEFDEGFPILGPSTAAQSRPVKKRRALPSWGPDDV
ncbi:hypothetical protein AURDEDRAFT_110251 [Auricularia subglabra TFB-10046 SS5]|nr:hypothetical protein AURDEDRAFT_110251 [Auricularia subglabra TFB-10046 SS5]